MRRFLFAFLCATTSVWGSAVLVTSASQISSASNPDVVVWSKLGPDQATAQQTFFVSSSNYENIMGRFDNGNGTVLSAGTDYQPSGGITAGDALLWASDGTNSAGNLSLYTDPIMGLGAYLQSDSASQFTARIQAFSGVSSVLDMSVTSDSIGSAMFLGVSDSLSDISRVVYSVSSGVATGSFVVGTVYIQNQPIAVSLPQLAPQVSGPLDPAPEPGALSLVALGILALGFKLRKHQARI